ncbi:MAG: precorrin-6A reductase [Clostridia bacterium]|nr:precorrin-6A reductase [Clostridia bacterium]
MRILIFGGTTEGRLLARELNSMGHAVTVSVATPLGAEELNGTDCAVRTGRLDAEEMADLVSGYDLVIDATHPFAREVSRNIREACERHGVGLRRVLRGESDTGEGLYFDSHEQAAAYLAAQEGNVLLTTGAKELAAYGDIERERLYPRVLPAHGSLEACEKAGIPHRNVIAMQGPFTKEMNLALIRQYDIRYLVTKDSGEAGGFAQKKEAALTAGIGFVVIRRPHEEGLTVQEMLRELEGKI